MSTRMYGPEEKAKLERLINEGSNVLRELEDLQEGLTKKTFYDSPRIVLTDLEQSLLEKTSTSLV